MRSIHYRSIYLPIAVFLTFICISSPATANNKFLRTITTFCAEAFGFDIHTSKNLEKLRRAESEPPYFTTDKFGTTLYYLAHFDPHPIVPEIKNTSTGVVIALGGSGSIRGNGSAFMRNAASLQKFDVSLISFDYPYHGNGPVNSKYNNVDIFLNQVTAIIAYIRSAGLPVIIMGHSFGSIVIQELTSRNPELLDAAIMISPGGNQTPRLLKHYLNFRFSQAWQEFLNVNDIEMNYRAERWAEGSDGKGGVGGAFQSTGDLTPIPYTKPLFVIAGEDDPWNSRDLLSEIGHRYPNGRLEIVAGANHQSILSFKAGKETVITNHIIALFTDMGVAIHKDKAKADNRVKLAFLNQQSRIFEEWIDKHHSGVDFRSIDDEVGARILGEWNDYVFHHILDKILQEKFSRFSVAFFESLKKPDVRMDLVFINNRQANRHSVEARRQVADYFLSILAILQKPFAERTQQENERLMTFLIKADLRETTNMKLGIDTIRLYFPNSLLKTKQ